MQVDSVFGNDDMKRFLNLVILVGLVGVFFSAFAYWMANSSHQDAERRRHQGEYIPPGNAASVARNMSMTCAGFVVLALAGLSAKVLCRTRRSTEPPPSKVADTSSAVEGGCR
jgi:Na+/H+-translocating membrane pyrophosphatase